MHESGKSVECRNCPESFYNMMAYLAHRLEKHPDMVRSRKKTNQKTKQEKAKAVSKNVIETTSTVKQRNASPNTRCVLCGKIFETLGSYKVHKYEHLNYTKDEVRTYCIDRIYPCKTCDRKFSSLKQIVSHVATHLVKTHECKICGQMFSFYLYRKHENELHKEHKCLICHEVFYGKL